MDWVQPTLCLALLLALFEFSYSMDLSSCCLELKLQSQGKASEHQSNRLGTYRLSTLFSDRPVYQNIEREEFLFYLTSRNRGLWMVGPEIGQFNGGLANRGDPTCAEDTPAGEWKYTDGESWTLDANITVTCLDQEMPDCEYKDQTNFQGGDLPSPLGGGGLETSSISSGECIQECENRQACRYWTWTGQKGVNCFLKTDKISQERQPKHVSGSISTGCRSRSIQVGEKNVEPAYNENEVNGKFKITSLKWNEKLTDPESFEYKELANSIEESLLSMLKNEGDFDEQAEFTVKVQKFKQGSVVCDFKVNYILKEAYVAIPFAIKPSNITTAMGDNFKFKKGILFQRFLIAANSFNASSPVDHCSAKGCSHKCDYDYDVEDYLCTCPRDLVLGKDDLTCLTEEEATTEEDVNEETTPATEDTTDNDDNTESTVSADTTPDDNTESNVSAD